MFWRKKTHKVKVRATNNIKTISPATRNGNIWACSADRPGAADCPVSRWSSLSLCLLIYKAEAWLLQR